MIKQTIVYLLVLGVISTTCLHAQYKPGNTHVVYNTHTSSESSLETLKNENARLKIRNEQLKGDNIRLQSRNEELRAINNQLKREKTELTRERDALSEKISNMEGKGNDLYDKEIKIFLTTYNLELLDEIENLKIRRAMLIEVSPEDSPAVNRLSVALRDLMAIVDKAYKNYKELGLKPDDEFYVNTSKLLKDAKALQDVFK